MAATKQLNNQFEPEAYTLDLSLNKATKVISGHLIIKGVRRSKPSYRITLHQKGLKVSAAKITKLTKDGSQNLKVTRIVHHTKLQEVRLHTDQQIISGGYIVELEYTGEISTKGNEGLYTSLWLDPNGQQSEIITTQFEPHYARQFLPSIDEPQAKAVINLTLKLSGTEKEDKVLFNTEPEVYENNNLEERLIKFKPTPIMSSYLLALVIGNLENNSTLSKSGTRISVHSTPDKINSTQFALNFAKQALDLLEDRFNTPYPLEKLDLVAVPDFDDGGMENWGLITFREDLLLFDEETSTLADKQAISLVIAHEIAHQWFGNLVTMKWWDELWLNEGFANFMEYYVVDSIYPEWKMFESYLINEKSYATRVDSLPSSRAIIKKVTSPHHAVEAFDEIAYEKSGSIVRMVFNLMGEDSFMLGVKDYFAQYAYKSALSGDLIKCWQKYTKLDLSKFINAWLSEPGLPKIEVSVGSNQRQIVLEQSRFLSQTAPRQSAKTIHRQVLKEKPNTKPKQRQFYENSLMNSQDKAYTSVWQIPIDFVYSTTETSNSAHQTEPFVMTKQKHVVQFRKDQRMPIKLNKDGSSFYLANYSTEFLAGISKAISNNSIDNLDILNLLTDIISLNRSGQFEPGAGAILEIIKSGKSITNPYYWASVGAFIGYLHYHLKQISKTNILRAYVSEIISKNIEIIGFSSSKADPSETVITRFELLSLATLVRDEQCTTKLIDLYNSSKERGIDSIEAEKRLLALYAVAKKGLEKDYNYLLKSYMENLSEPSLRDDLAYALCLFEDEKYVLNNLQLMQDPKLVKTQDILSWLSQLTAAGQAATNLTLEWLIKKDGWEWLTRNLSSHDLSHAVKIILSTAFTTKQLNKLKKFLEKANNIELEKALQESIDLAKSRISWHQKELPKVIDYLCEASQNHVIYASVCWGLFAIKLILRV